MNTRTKMPTYHVKCVETVYFTVKVEAESEKQAEDLALDDINSHELVSEATSDWDIEEIIFRLKHFSKKLFFFSEKWNLRSVLPHQKVKNGLFF